MSDQAQPLDHDAVRQLALELMQCVRAHYHRRPVSRSTAQEVLNAAAIVVSLVLGAARTCGDEAGAREFFELALEEQLEDGSLPETLGDLDRVLR
jgi:hypothetical protein